MSLSEENYRIWKNDNFIVESKIDISLWDKKIICEFQENLNQVFDEIYKISDLNLPVSKNLISLSFSGDKKISELNNHFRKIKSATNVLTFPFYSNHSNETFLGDIIFSLETICKEARRDKKTVKSHITHLFIHGVLHLLGYGHETDEQAKKMENLEIQILQSLQIENPYK